MKRDLTSLDLTWGATQDQSKDRAAGDGLVLPDVLLTVGHFKPLLEVKNGSWGFSASNRWETPTGEGNYAET